MYKIKDNLIFGFHGCDKRLCDSLVNGTSKKLNYSTNQYDWLGKGMYFWENDPDRAYQWAVSLTKKPQNSKQKIDTPAVLGAVICLGNCLDFTDQANLQKLKDHYESIKEAADKQGLELPVNKGGKDNLVRELDCLLINSLVAKQKEEDPDQMLRQFRGLLRWRASSLLL